MLSGSRSASMLSPSTLSLSCEEADDRQLLAEFVGQGRQEAFAVLVYRHHARIFAVCYRILCHVQDAEDAVQTTFLVLARKAKCLTGHDSLGRWLCAAAQRIAMKARTREYRRQRREQKLKPVSVSSEVVDRQALHQMLDEELKRMPALFRIPLLLCYLEDKTREQAAAELGCSPGAVKGRLERGRALLRIRLIRRDEYGQPDSGIEVDV